MTTIETPARLLWKRRPHVRPGTPLSDREREVLTLVSRGFTNAQVATRLYLTEDTVKSHLRAVTRRLSAHGRAHAVRRGFELGLLTADTEQVAR